MVKRKQKKILNAVLKTTDYGVPFFEEMARSGVGAEQFRKELLTDKGFKGEFLGQLQTALAADMPQILQRFVVEAMDGSFKHGKLLMELAGLYEEKRKLTGTMSLKHSLERPFKDEDERMSFIEATKVRALEGAKNGEKGEVIDV